MDFSKYSKLAFSLDGKILTVTFNDPDRLNPLDAQAEKELCDFLHEGWSDPSFNVVILTGAGRAFSAGGDIGFMEEVMNDPSLFGVGQAKRTVLAMIDFPKPVIAKVNGHAVGLGATVALLCDIIIADERARFGDTHIKVGLVAGDGGAVVWPLLVGVARAKEFLLTGDLIQATEAERIGLVNRVVPAGQAYTEGLALAKRLAAGPTRAIRWTKLALNKRLKDEVNLVLDASLAVETLSMATDDHREAARAFVEKRPPRFTGN